MSHNRQPSPRYLAARATARVWAFLCLASALSAAPLWYAAYWSGFLASPYHAAFEVIASAAFAVTCFAPFAAWGWIEYADKKNRYS